MLDLKESGDWDISSIKPAIENKFFDSALINLYSPYSSMATNNDGNSVHSMLLQLISVLKTKQMQLVVRISDSNREQDLLQWYRTMYTLFFDHHYALLAAGTGGMCGRRIERCRYRLSFVHYTDEKVELPVFGLGSPLEERKRFLAYLFGHKEEMCYNENMEKDFPLCTTFFYNKTDCFVVLVSYRNVTFADTLPELRLCKIIFVSPSHNNWSFPVHRFLNVGISVKENESMEVPASNAGEFWRLVPFSEILKQVSATSIDLVILDMDGSEWDVFDAVLRTPELKIVQQIGLRLRLWIGEENENFRCFLSHLLQLEKSGFHKVAAVKESRSAFKVLYNRISTS